MSLVRQESLFEVVGAGVVADTTLLPSVALHPAVAGWFRERFPDGPTPAQSASWPAIAAGEHLLVAAPTGSGKTLAGFLMAINRLYLAFACGDTVSGLRVVYVSPPVAASLATSPRTYHRVLRPPGLIVTCRASCRPERLAPRAPALRAPDWASHRGGKWRRVSDG